MRRPNGRGQITHGVGGGYVSIDNRAIHIGGSGGWMDDATIVFANGDDNWVVSAYDQDFKQTRRLLDVPANDIHAGGGHFASQLASRDADRGLWSSTGLRLPDAGLLGMGPDAAIAYKPQYHSYGPSVIRELDGSEWLLSPGVPSGICLLGNGQVLVDEGGKVEHRVRVGDRAIAGPQQPQIVYDSGTWFVQSVLAGGEWWILYFSGAHGIVLQPYREPRGYSILAKGDGWPTIGALTRDKVRIAISRTQGEQPGDIWGMDVNVQTGEAWAIYGGESLGVLPRVDIASINPVEPPIPPPEPDMKKPEVTVERWTLDHLRNGEVLVAYDRENPDANCRTKVWIENGSLYIEMSNKAGSGRTGAFRKVYPS